MQEFRNGSDYVFFGLLRFALGRSFRLRTPNLVRRRSTCFSTVRMLMPSSAAISLSKRPSRMRAMTSFSRLVRPTAGASDEGSEGSRFVDIAAERDG